MADRQTMNVSLPEAQERFVRAQVASGRYRSASEVLRDGLRMLEEAEHRRLLEKWFYEDLTDDERSMLPPDLAQRAREHLQRLISEAKEDVRRGRVTDGPDAVARLRDELTGRGER